MYSVPASSHSVVARPEDELDEVPNLDLNSSGAATIMLFTTYTVLSGAQACE